MKRIDTKIDISERANGFPENRSRVIYGDSPFIEDMGMLTSLCLLHDEVVLIGRKSLDEELASYWDGLGDRAKDATPTVVEHAIQLLLPESVISYYSFEDSKGLWDDQIGEREIGIRPGGCDDAKKVIYFDYVPSNQDDFSKLLIGGISDGPRTVNGLLRDLSILSASVGLRVPIVSNGGCIITTPSTTFVSEAANHLASVAMRALVLPELEAYSAEDILEARLKLSSELQAFRTGILDLVWLLYQRSGLIDDITKFQRDCEVLVSTKICAALSSLESAIRSHQNKGIRRILKTAGAAFMEVGKASLGEGFAGLILGASGAVLKVSEHQEGGAPTVPIASYLYRVREKKFK